MEKIVTTAQKISDEIEINIATLDIIEVARLNSWMITRYCLAINFEKKDHLMIVSSILVSAKEHDEERFDFFTSNTWAEWDEIEKAWAIPALCQEVSDAFCAFYDLDRVCNKSHRKADHKRYVLRGRPFYQLSKKDIDQWFFIDFKQSVFCRFFPHFHRIKELLCKVERKKQLLWTLCPLDE